MKEEIINTDFETTLYKPLVFKTIDGIVYYNYSNILLFKADGHSTWLYTVCDSPLKPYNCIRILDPLSYIERKYCNCLLFKCHRSTIINLMHIEKLEIKTHKLHLRYGIIVQVSKDCIKHFRDL